MEPLIHFKLIIFNLLITCGLSKQDGMLIDVVMVVSTVFYLINYTKEVDNNLDQSRNALFSIPKNYFSAFSAVGREMEEIKMIGKFLS